MLRITPFGSQWHHPLKKDKQLSFFKGFWWRIAGSNRWPPACKAGALPAELIPLLSCFSLYTSSALTLACSHTLGMLPAQSLELPRLKKKSKIIFNWLGVFSLRLRIRLKMVGLRGLEPLTLPLSGVRSNHLSYKPLFHSVSSIFQN